MTDLVDRAQAREEAEREAALERARDRAHEASRETPFEIEGRRVCLECFEPIDRRRLKANPQAVRCLECQTTQERRRRGSL